MRLQSQSTLGPGYEEEQKLANLWLQSFIAELIVKSQAFPVQAECLVVALYLWP